MPSDSDIVQKFSELINQSSPSITRSPSGLSITQNGQTYEIPFKGNAVSVSKTSLIKK